MNNVFERLDDVFAPLSVHKLDTDAFDSNIDILDDLGELEEMDEFTLLEEEVGECRGQDYITLIGTANDELQLISQGKTGFIIKQDSYSKEYSCTRIRILDKNKKSVIAVDDQYSPMSVCIKSLENSFYKTDARFHAFIFKEAFFSLSNIIDKTFGTDVAAFLKEISISKENYPELWLDDGTT